MLDGIILPLTPMLYPATRPPPDVSGQGYLAGNLPDGLTMVEGVPTSAEDGTWLVQNLDPDLKFDVICRYPGYNDMILSNVSPVLATGPFPNRGP